MDLKDLMAMAGQLREKIAQAQPKLEQLRAHGEAGGGMVKVTVNGLHHLLDLKIEPAAVAAAPDMSLLSSLLRSAINQAVMRLAEQLEAQKVKMAADLGVNMGDFGMRGPGGL